MTKARPTFNGPTAQHMHVFSSYLGTQGWPGIKKGLQQESHIPFLFSSSLTLTSMIELLSLSFILLSISPFFLLLSSSSPFLSSILFCLHLPSFPSLPSELHSITFLPHYPRPSLGVVMVLAECLTPSEESRALGSHHSPYFLQSLQWGLGERNGGKKGSETLDSGLQMLLLVHWRRETGQLMWELPRRIKREKGG